MPISQAAQPLKTTTGTHSTPGAADVHDGHERGSREYRRLVIALFAAGVATFGQLYSLQGLLPNIAHHFQVSPAQAALTVSAATSGIAISVLPWAFISDRIGRVRAMTIAVIIASLLFLAGPFSASFEIMIALRFLEGLALGALPAAAVVYISEEVNPRHIAVAAGTYVSGTSLGGLAGRLIPGFITHVADWRIAVVIEGIIAVIAAVVFIRLAPRARRFVTTQQRRASGIKVQSAGASLKAALSNPRLWVLYLQGLFLMGSFVAIFNYIGFRLDAPPFSLPVAVTSLLYCSYLVGTFTSRTAGKLVSRWGRLPITLTAIIVLMAGIALTTSHQVLLILLGLCCVVAGYFAAHSVINAWVPALVPDAAAQASAAYTLCTYIGSSIVGYAAGLIYAAAGWTTTGISLMALVAISGVLLLIARPRTVTHASTANEASPRLA